MTSFDQCVIAPAGRFDGIQRPYSPEDVLRLRGSVPTGSAPISGLSRIEVSDRWPQALRKLRKHFSRA